MGYAVEYNFGVSKTKPIVEGSRQGRRAHSGFLYVLVTIAIFLSAIIAFQTDFFIPGNKEITKEAFESLLQTVEDGTDIHSAVTAFCKEVISGAQLQ